MPTSDVKENGETMSLNISLGRPRTVGLITILVAFGGFGTWSVLAPLGSAAFAPGIVQVKESRKTVQHLEGGIIDTMYVGEGDYIEADQPILKLDETQDRAQLSIILGQFLAAKAEESRLMAEQQGSSTIEFPPLLTDSPDARAGEAMSGQENFFHARLKSLEGRKNVLKYRISQSESRIGGIRSIRQGKVELIDSYSREIADYESLLEEGYADKTYLRRMQREVAKLRSEVADSEASIAGARIEISETELEVLQLDRNFLTQVADQLDEVRTRLFDLDERRRVLTDKLLRTEILAPVSGVVLDMSITTIGGVVKPGEPILDIVPEDDELVVKAQLSPKDIDRVTAGQLADIRFGSFNTREIPAIEGRLSKVSADILNDPNTRKPYYSATIEITERGNRMLRDIKLVPGMPANVLIKTGERTLFQYLLAPITETFAVAMIED